MNERYLRQISLKEIGDEGQEKLRRSRVLVIGAGGLGSPVIMYLAAAGAGNIGIADGDCAEPSNLQRQIIHTSESLGVNKAESAAEYVRRLDPLINVRVYPRRLDETDIGQVIGEYDVVIDAVDRMSAKLMISDACVRAGIPYCHGGVSGFTGQAMTCIPGKSPCLRCVFGTIPDDPPAGVMGMTCGVIGSVQALEAVKLITGAGEPLTGRIFSFDGLSCRARTISCISAERCDVCREIM